jgi:hypothetical protein
MLEERDRIEQEQTEDLLKRIEKTHPVPRPGSGKQLAKRFHDWNSAMGADSVWASHQTSGDAAALTLPLIQRRRRRVRGALVRKTGVENTDIVLNGDRAQRRRQKAS